MVLGLLNPALNSLAVSPVFFLELSVSDDVTLFNFDCVQDSKEYVAPTQ